jgi:putative MFS transporter
MSNNLRLDRRAKATVVSAYLGWVFDYYEIFMLTFLIIPITSDLDLSSGEAAGLFAWSLASLAVGGVTMGLAADRFGRRPILMLTIVIYALATLSRAAAPNYDVLVLLTVIAGLGIGGEYGVGQSLISEIVPARRRGLWSGVVYGGCFVGIMAAALVGGYVMPSIGWRWTFALSSLPVLLAIYVRAATPESEIWQAQVDEDAARPLQAFWDKRFLKPLAICTIIATVYFSGYYGVATFLPKYLVDEGVSVARASWWIFFSGAAGLVGNLVAAVLMDRLGRRRTLMGLMVLASASAVALALTWHSLLTSNFIFVLFFLVFVGANGATVFGSMFSEVFATRVRTTGVSSALQIARGLVFVVPLIVAYVLPRYGYVPVVVASAVEFLLVGGLAWLFPDRSNVDIRIIDRSVSAAPASHLTHPVSADERRGFEQA